MYIAITWQVLAIYMAMICHVHGKALPRTWRGLASLSLSLSFYQCLSVCLLCNRFGPARRQGLDAEKLAALRGGNGLTPKNRPFKVAPERNPPDGPWGPCRWLRCNGLALRRRQGQAVVFGRKTPWRRAAAADARTLKRCLQSHYYYYHYYYYYYQS